MAINFPNIICLGVLLSLYLQKVICTAERYPYSIKRQTWSSEEEGFTIELDVKSRKCFLDLYFNRDLISENYFEKYHTSETHFVIQRPKAQKIELCHYTGKIRDVQNSWIAVTTCEGIRGFMFDSRNRYTIADFFPNNGISVHGNEMIVRSRNNASKTDLICGDEASGDTTAKIRSRVKRDSNSFNISLYYVELALVIDNSFFKAMNSDLTLVHRRCKDIINLLNSVYSKFQIFISIACIDVWSHGDRIPISNNIDVTFLNFSTYAEGVLNKYRVDNVQLLSHVKFDEYVLGTAQPSGMCMSRGSFGISYDSMNDDIEETTSTLAHEMAHNIGVDHDDKYCRCEGQLCIMSSSGFGILEWSWCSSLSFKTVLLYSNSLHCLSNKPTSAFNTRCCDDYTSADTETYYLSITTAVGCIALFCLRMLLMNINYTLS